MRQRTYAKAGLREAHGAMKFDFRLPSSAFAAFLALATPALSQEATETAPSSAVSERLRSNLRASSPSLRATPLKSRMRPRARLSRRLPPNRRRTHSPLLRLRRRRPLSLMRQPRPPNRRPRPSIPSRPSSRPPLPPSPLKRPRRPLRRRAPAFRRRLLRPPMRPSRRQ